MVSETSIPHPQGSFIRFAEYCHQAPSSPQCWAHLDISKPRLLDKEIWQDIVLHFDWQRLVTRCFFLVIITIYTSAGRTQQGWGDGIHTKVDKLVLISWGFVDFIVSSAQAIHCKLDMCCLQILRSLNGLVCYI
jgi:hypothetical protein